MGQRDARWCPWPDSNIEKKPFVATRYIRVGHAYSHIYSHLLLLFDYVHLSKDQFGF